MTTRKHNSKESEKVLQQQKRSVILSTRKNFKRVLILRDSDLKGLNCWEKSRKISDSKVGVISFIF